MPDYNPNPLFAGIAQGFKGAEDAAEEYKTRAREFKALQEFADATGIADKDRTTTMDLESLRGFVRAGEARRVEAERQRATQRQDALLKLQQDQFAETKRMHAEQEHSSGLDRLDRRYQQTVEQGRYREADRRAEGDFALRQSAGSFSLSEAQKAAAQAEAQRIATLQAIRAMQGDPALANRPLARLSLGGAMPDVKALGDMRDLMQPPAQPGTVLDVPGLPGYKYGVQNRQGAGSFLPAGGAAAAKPMSTADRVKVEAEISKTLNLYNKAPDAATRGRYLDVLQQLEAMRGGGAPASQGPASQPAASPKTKVQRANELAAQNPGWSREQVIDAVNREFSR